MEIAEKTIDCPYCGEPITILVDPSVAEQEYVEDCQVCCRPIEVAVRGSDDDGFDVSVRAEDDTG